MSDKYYDRIFTQKGLQMRSTLYKRDAKSGECRLYALQAHAKDQNTVPKCINEAPAL